MAKLKKSAKKGTAGDAGAQAQAERLSRTLSESAQQIWLAGVGAFSRAQAEGNKLFESLVKEGVSLEQTARKLAGNRAGAVRDVMENRVGQARERAVDTWDKLEKVFEERVQRALTRLGVPGRDELSSLADRVDALNAQLRKLNGEPATRRSPARKSAATATAPRKRAAGGAKKTAARKPATKKAAVRRKPRTDAS